MRMNQFDYTIEHRPGTSNKADYFSRHPCKAGPSAFLEEFKTERYVNMVMTNIMPATLTLAEVAAACKVDYVTQALSRWSSRDCQDKTSHKVACVVSHN